MAPQMTCASKKRYKISWPTFKRLNPFLASLLCLAIQQSATAEQFGLRMGESASQIKAKGIPLKKEQGLVWSTPKVPNGNRTFDDYRLLISPKSGLCKIMAWTPRIEDSKYGDKTKDTFESLKTALTNKYGTPSNEFDFLRSGATWRENGEFMWSLYKKERYLSAYWKPGKGDISSIALEVSGISPEIALISVSYEFANNDKCYDEMKRVDSSNL